MIIMDIRADNLYAFRNFHLNMTYPKKIVDSTIEDECLVERPNFRYKKVNIIMGTNATGKTSLGRLIMQFANYLKDGSALRFLQIVDDTSKDATLKIDFVTRVNRLYRFHMMIPATAEKADPSEDFEGSLQKIQTSLFYTEINKKDNYNTCAKRLDSEKGKSISVNEINTSGWSFFYPFDAVKNHKYNMIENKKEYLRILEKILKTLDPSIEKVIKLSEVENTYAIKMGKRDLLIQNGEIKDYDIISSGTKAGLNIAYIISSLKFGLHDLYYCDEQFSYIASDIEKEFLSIIIDKLPERGQLFFTTHNTDVVDMQLPKHSFVFLKKDVSNLNEPITAVYADDLLKRNTDSLKNAVENDIFGVAPDLSELYDI